MMTPAAPPSRPVRPPRAAAREHERLLDENWRLREAAGRAAEETARHLAHAGHELRTPLAGIAGMAELLLAGPLSPAQADHARAIAASAHTLMDLVADMLEAGRLAAGRLDLRPDPVPLLPLLEDVVELIALRAVPHGLDVALALATPLPARVEVDAGRLRQVLVNLLDNAVKFTAEGGVELRVAAVPAAPGRVALDLAVTDTGPGIAEGDRVRIFESFERAAPDMRADGLGLGLAIARAIVTEMGGRIALDSRLGGGSTFRVTLDVPVAEDRSYPAPTLAGLSLLVAGPGVGVGALGVTLATLGAGVAVAETRWDLAAALASARPDALLITHGNGVDAGDWLGTLGPDAPPAIVLIAPGARAHLPRLAAQGFRAHLVQPARLASLARVIPAITAGLPVAPVTPDRRRVAAGPTVWTRAPRILVAEDDEIGALLARTLLARAGATVSVVGDGAAALDEVDAAHRAGRPFDLVLMDVNLPGLDGLAATAALRARPHAASLPVFVLTADADPATARAVRAAGAAGRLVKPLTPERVGTLLAAAKPADKTD